MLRIVRRLGAGGSAVAAIAVAAAGMVLAAAPTGSAALAGAAGGSDAGGGSVTLQAGGSGGERSVTLRAGGSGGEGSVTLQASTETAEPELAFVDVEPRMRSRAILLTEGEEYHDEDFGLGVQYFAQLSVEGDDDVVDGVVYSVEAVHGESPQWCRQGAPEPGCVGVEVGVRPDSGLMYLYMPRTSREWLYPTGEFPARRVDLSAEDSDSGLKVYRSVMVDRSGRAPDCDDYPDRNRDRFACIFLGETLPEDPPETTAALQNALPRLVKPKSEYQLVFEELFDDGVAANTAPCQNGIASLDAEIWHVDRDPCAKVDTAATPCYNVAAGSYSYGWFDGCTPHLSSEAGFAYKYGYLETKYTVEFVRGLGYLNYSLYMLPNYDLYTPSWDIEIETIRDHTTNVGNEIDIYELVIRRFYDIFHQYLNSSGDFDAVPKRRSRKHIYPCGTGSNSGTSMVFMTPSVCKGYSGTSVVTITKGVEWTPRGYLTYVKAEGLHDDLVAYPATSIRMEYRRSGSWVHLTEGSYTETFAAPGGNVTLEQMAVSHLPGWLRFGVLGWGDNSGTVKSRVHVDYVRVFQPENLYADMEPVYK